MKDEYNQFLKIPDECAWKKMAMREKDKNDVELTSLADCLNCNGTDTKCQSYMIDVTERNKYGFPKGIEKHDAC